VKGVDGLDCRVITTEYIRNTYFVMHWSM